MSEESAGSIFVEIKAKMDDFRKGLNEATDRLDKFEKDSERRRKRLSDADSKASKGSGLTLNNLTRSVAKLGAMIVALKTVSNIFKAIHENQKNMNTGFDGFVEKTENIIQQIPIIRDAYNLGSAITATLMYDGDKAREDMLREGRLKHDLARDAKIRQSKDVFDSVLGTGAGVYSQLEGGNNKRSLELAREAMLKKLQEQRRTVMSGFDEQTSSVKDTGRMKIEMDEYGQATVWQDESDKIREAIDKKRSEAGAEMLSIEEDINKLFDERLRKTERQERMQKAMSALNLKVLTSEVALSGMTLEELRSQNAIEGGDSRGALRSGDASMVRKKAEIAERGRRHILALEMQIVDAKSRGLTWDDEEIKLLLKKQELVFGLRDAEIERLSIKDKNRREDIGFSLDASIREQTLSNNDRGVELQFEKLRNQFADQLRSLGDLDMNQANAEKLQTLFGLRAQGIGSGGVSGGVAKTSVQSAIGSFSFGQDMAEKTSQNTADLLAEFKAFMSRSFSEGVPVALRAIE
jgi:hypothetical protein